MYQSTTFSTFRVSIVVRGQAKEGSNLIVLSPGDNIVFCTEQSPIPMTNTPYLVFLAPAQEGTDRFTITGGKFGRYQIVGDMLRSWRSGTAGLGDINGQTISQLKKTIDELPA